MGQTVHSVLLLELELDDVPAGQSRQTFSEMPPMLGLYVLCAVEKHSG